MGIISWIILGLIVGVIAKFIMPGKDPGGIFITILLGIAGEPGIGKTTLVEQFLEEVKITNRPCLIANGQCSERLAGTEAFLPIFEVLESLFKPGEEIVNLMRTRAPWWYAQVASISPADPANSAILADVKNANQERIKRELASFFNGRISTRVWGSNKR